MKSTNPSPDQKRQEALHTMLIKLRDETYERVHELRHEQGEDAETEPGDEMDRARTDTDVETHASLIARAEERLRYIDEAIGRVDEGRYGICAGCREHIPVERLRAVPLAIYCVDCQKKPDRVGRGWNEGGTIQPYDQQWTLPEEMEEARDITSASEEVRSVTTGSPFAEGGSARTSLKGKPKVHRPKN